MARRFQSIKSFGTSFALASLFFLLAQTQALAQEMTNADVIRLVKAGVAEDTVIAMIVESRSKAKFETSVDAVLQLKEAGVSDAIIRTMVGSPAASEENANSGLDAAPEAGLFVESGGQLVRLEPRVRQNKIKNRVMVVSYVAFLDGGSANVAVTEPRPRFIFSFANGVGQLAMSGPGEFILFKLSAKKDSRELDDKQSFKFEETSPRRYVVTPSKDLKPGEYAFYHDGSKRFFDFKILPGSTKAKK